LITSLIPLDGYLSALLDINIFKHISSLWLEITWTWILEIAIIMALLMGISYKYVWNLHKKLK
jgi:hypothetical protein